MAVKSKIFFQNQICRRIFYWRGKSRAQYIIKLIAPYLKHADRIVDIGAGSCNISELLLKKGFKVTPADIEDLSLVNQIKPIIIDGKKLPFKNDAFDVALIIGVLHHTGSPIDIIKEAKRVSPRLIIIEDIYTTRCEKYITYALDSLQNQEFNGHPHSNKTDAEWRLLFHELGLKLREAKYSHWVWCPPLKHATYYLKK